MCAFDWFRINNKYDFQQADTFAQREFFKFFITKDRTELEPMNLPRLLLVFHFLTHNPSLFFQKKKKRITGTIVFGPFSARLLRIWNYFIQTEYRKIRTRSNSVFGHFPRSVTYSNPISFSDYLYFFSIEQYVSCNYLIISL